MAITVDTICPSHPRTRFLSFDENDIPERKQMEADAMNGGFSSNLRGDTVLPWDDERFHFHALQRPIRVADLKIGDGRLALIAGPCSIESESLCLKIAEHLVRLCGDLGVPYVFKASIDKANRT